MPPSVFAPSPKTPGHGLIHAKILPPCSFALEELQFVYPLKLISSSKPTDKFITIFILSYGGGLVSNDRVDMKVVLDEKVKMCLLTQGSTKVFKLRPGDTLTSQCMNVHMASGSSLVLLPDPVQPFASSVYMQHQQFHIPKDGTASIVILDWISEGRSARGEIWDLRKLTSRNEVYEFGHENLPDGRRLLFRDSLILFGDEDGGNDEPLRDRMDGLACICTLIIRGPNFSNLSAHILSRFQSEPRVGKGGRGWDWDKNKQDENSISKFKDIIWSASSVRGFVLVKVSGKEIEEVRRFLRDILLEGKAFANADEIDEFSPDIIREYGFGSLRCLE